MSTLGRIGPLPAGNNAVQWDRCKREEGLHRLELQHCLPHQLLIRTLKNASPQRRRHSGRAHSEAAIFCIPDPTGRLPQKTDAVTSVTPSIFK